MVNCQQLYFCFPYKSLYKVILKCKRKVVYWSYMHVLYNLMYRLIMNVVSLIWNYENILDMKIYSETHFVSLQGFLFQNPSRNYHDLAPNFFSFVLCKTSMHLSSIRCKIQPPFFVPKNAKKGKECCSAYLCLHHLLLTYTSRLSHYMMTLFKLCNVG